MFHFVKQKQRNKAIKTNPKQGNTKNKIKKENRKSHRERETKEKTGDTENVPKYPLFQGNRFVLSK